MTRIKCSECNEPVQTRKPTSWNADWGPAPAVSHMDGEPLCPVVGDRGYEPAQPTSAK